MTQIKPIKYQVAIIGAGPAGLMAASRASELGAQVILIEKNDQPGLKLLITGGGRCNLTNNIEDYKLLAANFGQNGRFLLSAFSRFGVSETINFFENLGLRTKVEKNNQVFPVSDRSQEVRQVLIDHIVRSGGEIRSGAGVKRVVVSDGRIDKLILSDGQEISAVNYVLAVGGRSYPLTGSTGDGYAWLESMGHKLVPLRPALAPLIVQEKIVKALEGLSLTAVTLSLFQDGRKIIDLSGDIVFTANGLSGPAALNLSRYLDFREKKLKLNLDFFPRLSRLELDRQLQDIFHARGRKNFKNSLLDLLPPKLIPVIIKLTEVPEEKKAAAISKSERQAIVDLLKSWPLTITAVGGYDKAMVTSGGLDLAEVDPKTMRSKIIANLFVAGELLAVDGPTGGYNLQLCWSTGHAAGESAALNQTIQ